AAPLQVETCVHAWMLAFCAAVTLTGAIPAVARSKSARKTAFFISNLLPYKDRDLHSPTPYYRSCPSFCQVLARYRSPILGRCLCLQIRPDCGSLKDSSSILNRSSTADLHH